MLKKMRVLAFIGAVALILNACDKGSKSNPGASQGGTEPQGGPNPAPQAFQPDALKIHSYKVAEKHSDFFGRRATFHIIEVDKGVEAMYLQRYGKNTFLRGATIYSQYRCKGSAASCDVFTLRKSGDYVQITENISVKVREDSQTNHRIIEIGDPYVWTFSLGSEIAEFSIQVSSNDRRSSEVTATLTKE